MGLIAMSKRDLQRIEVLSTVIARRMARNQLLDAKSIELFQVIAE